jgi:hypothetical protein
MLHSLESEEQEPWNLLKRPIQTCASITANPLEGGPFVYFAGLI